MKIGIRDIRAIAKSERSFERYWQERQKQREKRKDKHAAETKTDNRIREAARRKV